MPNDTPTRTSEPGTPVRATAASPNKPGTPVPATAGSPKPGTPVQARTSSETFFANRTPSSPLAVSPLRPSNILDAPRRNTRKQERQEQLSPYAFPVKSPRFFTPEEQPKRPAARKSLNRRFAELPNNQGNDNSESKVWVPPVDSKNKTPKASKQPPQIIEHPLISPPPPPVMKGLRS